MSADAHLDDSNLLAAYVEGRVSDAERRLVTEHLTRCDACRAALAALGRGMNDVPASTHVETGAAAATGIRFLGLRPIAWLPVAAVFAIATVSGIHLLRTAQPPVTVTPDAAPSQLAAPPGKRAPDAGTPSPAAPEAARPSRDPASVDPSLLARRSSERRIGGKAFRLVAGEWIDTAYDPVAGRPEVRTDTPEETTALTRRVPGLEPYASLGARVLVVLDGTVYRLRGSAR